MFSFIDLCCGTGALRKSFERTGYFRCILSADIDENMQNLSLVNIGPPKPLGDLTSETVDKIIEEFDYDVLTAGINGLNESILFKLLEIIERDRPKAFVFEMDAYGFSKSFCKTIDVFCKKNGYVFVDYNKSIETIVLDLFDFGIAEHCERVWAVCLNKKELRTEYDPLFHQLTKKHDFKCYDEYNPEKNIEQKRGLDFGFGRKFKFLQGTPENKKKEIVDQATPMPVAMSVALDLGSWLI